MNIQNILDDMEQILEDHPFEEILGDNDLTEAEVLYHLYRWGLLKLPETKPLTAGSGGPVRFDEIY